MFFITFTHHKEKFFLKYPFDISPTHDDLEGTVFCSHMPILKNHFTCLFLAVLDHCSSFSLLGLRSCGSQALSTSPIIMAHGLSCSGACGIFLDQGSNPCLLRWQADSLPLSHQESPKFLLLFIGGFLFYVKTSQVNHV